MSNPDPRVPPDYDQPTQPNYQYQGPVNRMDDNTVRSANNANDYYHSQHENYVDPRGNQVENRVEIAEDRNQSRANARYWTTTLTYFLLGVLEVILGLRWLFRLLGANQSNGFIMFLYGLSHVFVAPFNGIFNDQALGTSSVFEVSTIIAMLVYALIAWGIVSLGRVIFAPIVSGEQRVTTTRRRSR